MIKTAKAKQKVISKDKVLIEALKYFNDDELAATTWMKKYAVKNENGEFLEKSPEEMHKRMAKEFARIENRFEKLDKENLAKLSTYGKKRTKLTEEKIFNYFKDFKYVIPQGSVMAALGNSHMIASLSNCVVVPSIMDSYGGIMHTDQQLVQLFKRRCGVV